MKKNLLLFLLFFGSALSIQAQQTYLNEDFESGADGWTLETEWQIGDYTSNSSQFWGYPESSDGDFASFNDDAAGETAVGGGMIISPAFDLSGASDVLLTYQCFYPHENYNGAGQEQFKVMVSTDAGGSWTEVFAHTVAISWGRTGISLADFAGESEVMLAFEYDDGNNWNFGVGLDNIWVGDARPRDIVLTPDAEPIILASHVGDGVGETTVDYLLENYGTEELTSAVFEFDINGEITQVPFTGSVPYLGSTVITLTGLEVLHAEIVREYNPRASMADFNGEALTPESEVLTTTDALFNVSIPLPPFAATSVSGNSVDVYEMVQDGYSVTIDYMASWCGPCQTSTPLINQKWVDFGSGEQGMEVLAISVEETDSDAVVAGLNWGADYPKFGYSNAGEFMYTIHNGARGTNSIPFFVTVCPNTEYPGFSDVVHSEVGFDDFSALSAAVTECDATIGTDEFGADEISGIDDIVSLNTMTIAPNPVTSASNLFLQLEQEEVVNFSISDIAGKVVYRENLGTQNGEVVVSLGDKNLANGIYTVNVQIGNQLAAKKIHVIK